MYPLKGKHQEKLAKQLQSTEHGTLLAGSKRLIRALQSVFPAHTSAGSGSESEGKFAQCYPCLAQSLPQILVSLLNVASNDVASNGVGSDLSGQAICSLLDLARYLPESLCQIMTSEQLKEFVKVVSVIFMVGELNGQPEAQRPLFYAVSGLLRSWPVNTGSRCSSFEAVAVFFKDMVSDAKDSMQGPHKFVLHESALVAAEKALEQMCLQQLGAAAGGNRDSTCMEWLKCACTVASWDLHQHVHALLRDIQQEGQQRRQQGACAVLNCLLELVKVLQLLPDCLEHASTEQRAQLQGVHAEFVQLLTSPSLSAIEASVSSSWQLSNLSTRRQALWLLQRSWLPFEVCFLNRPALGSAPLSSSSANSGSTTTPDSTSNSSQAHVLVQVASGKTLAAQDAHAHPHEPSASALIVMWLQVLRNTSCSIPTSLATETGVRALLQAGFLRGIKTGVQLKLHTPTCDLELSELIAILLWYAQRFPAVAAGIAAEHVALSRRRHKRAAAKEQDCSANSSHNGVEGDSKPGPTLQVGDQLPAQGSEKSLWEVLHDVVQLTDHDPDGSDPRVSPGDGSSSSSVLPQEVNTRHAELVKAAAELVRIATEPMLVSAMHCVLINFAASVVVALLPSLEPN